MNIQFPLPGGSEYAFTLDPLFAPIDPSSSKVSVMSTKIEITLRKQHPGQKWNALEATGQGTTPAVNPVPSSTPAPATATTTATDSGPAYPTSSRQGAKNWDKIATDLTQKKKNKNKKANTGEDAANKTDKKDDGNDSDSADSDYESGDPVDSFFKKLYSNADPDTRRAMVKSFTESQGTALSTNWTDVQKGKVETRPPNES